MCKKNPLLHPLLEFLGIRQTVAAGLWSGVWDGDGARNSILQAAAHSGPAGRQIPLGYHYPMKHSCVCSGARGLRDSGGL